MSCSISCRKRIRHTAISIVTFVLGPGFIVSSHAQSYRSTADKKVVHTKRTTARDNNGDAGAGKDASAPESWARRAYRNPIYFHEADKAKILTFNTT